MTAAEFWSRVDRAGGPEACWPWQGPGWFKGGYGAVRVNGKRMGAHRYAYILEHGEIAPGLVVRHGPGCVTACCNPAHLKTGSQADNVGDLWSKRIRRAAQARAARKRLSRAYKAKYGDAASGRQRARSSR